jgi:hypothetical protein
MPSSSRPRRAFTRLGLDVPARGRADEIMLPAVGQVLWPWRCWRTHRFAEPFTRRWTTRRPEKAVLAERAMRNALRGAAGCGRGSRSGEASRVLLQGVWPHPMGRSFNRVSGGRGAQRGWKETCAGPPGAAAVVLGEIRR